MTRNYPAHDGLWRAWGKETEKGCLALLGWLVIVMLVLVALAGCAAEQPAAPVEYHDNLVEVAPDMFGVAGAGLGAVPIVDLKQSIAAAVARATPTESPSGIVELIERAEVCTWQICDKEELR